MREFFAAHPAIERFSVERQLTKWAKWCNWRVVYVQLDGIHHRQKEEKRGFWRGFADRLKMYGEILVKK
ncbi:MAG: hypothetical protein V1826_00595 [bacterium]